jgi:hypothetical protein
MQIPRRRSQGGALSGFAEVDGQKVGAGRRRVLASATTRRKENRRADAARQLAALADTPENAGERRNLGSVAKAGSRSRSRGCRSPDSFSM